MWLVAKCKSGKCLKNLQISMFANRREIVHLCEFNVIKNS